MRLATACATVLLTHSIAGAQTFSGRVLDATDSAAVSGAEITVSGMRRIRTSGTGAFRFADASAGAHDVTVRMLGYAPFSETLTLAAGQPVTRDIYLTRVPHLLSQMVVRGRSLRVPAGFEDVYGRAKISNSALITREQIDSINPRDVVALLNFTGPIRASANRGAPDRLHSSRCRPMVPGAPSTGPPIQLFLNGAPIRNIAAINEILDHLAPSNIQAVEMYNGPTSVPPTFQPACGALAIWTRRG